MPSWVSLNPSECQDFSAINKIGCFAPHFSIKLNKSAIDRSELVKSHDHKKAMLGIDPKPKQKLHMGLIPII